MLECTPEMPAYCFQVLEAELHGTPRPAVPAAVPNVDCPIFVCYKTLSGDLRGCIGNFAASPLHEQLADYSIQSALKDRRFSPVRPHELKGLKCTVSLLHSFEPAPGGWKDWTIGQHGIRIFFKDDKGRAFGATYLPSVALQQGWNHQEAVHSLIKKAGFNGNLNSKLLDNIRVERYQESEYCVSYHEVSKYLNQ